ncbi:hypothetical protein [Ornithobacterium rhinotracheale]|uniref:hypothetical protein n=1 Tax=Ornithobacterium rhinotracheale TaxID=28251 RepID=UPI0040354946
MKNLFLILISLFCLGVSAQEKKEHKTIYVKFDFTGNDKSETAPVRKPHPDMVVFTRSPRLYTNYFIWHKNKPKIKVSQKLLNNIQFTETAFFEKEKSKDYTINLVEIKEDSSIFYYPNVEWNQWIDLE